MQTYIMAVIACAVYVCKYGLFLLTGEMSEVIRVKCMLAETKCVFLCVFRFSC